MSVNPAGNEVLDENAPIPAVDEVRDENASIEPPIALHPLARFRPLVLPGIFVVLIIFAVIYAVIPVWNALCATDNAFEKIRDEGVKAYSRNRGKPPDGCDLASSDIPHAGLHPCP